jgi:hypothetical protein
MYSRSIFFCLWGEEGSFKDFLNFDVPNGFTLVLTNSWFLEEPLSFALEFLFVWKLRALFFWVLGTFSKIRTW